MACSSVGRALKYVAGSSPATSLWVIYETHVKCQYGGNVLEMRLRP